VNSNEGELYNLASDSEEYDNLFNNTVYTDVVTDMKLEIVKKMTAPLSEQRKIFIRSLFDNSTSHRYKMMEKLYKWDRSIVDGGGFWMVFRNEYRLIYIPFDNKLTFYELDNDKTIEDRTMGWVPSDNRKKREQLIDELLNYISTTIRPVSLLSGSQEAWDNMLQKKGPGLC
jgi:hypothetical protein